MKAFRDCAAALALIAVLGLASPSRSQTVDWIDGGATNDFADGGNWSTGSAPFFVFSSSARIGGDTGTPGVPPNPTATVTTDLSGAESPNLTLGDGNGFEGTLSISSGGLLAIEAGSGQASGNLDVGTNGGRGTLIVSGSGQLDVRGALRSGGDAASTIELSNTAVVTANSVNLDRNLILAGPDVDFSTTGDAFLGDSGTHEWAFTPSGAGSGPSVLSVGGNLRLGGTLKLSTSGQPLPIGSTFVVADSTSVSNGFASIDLSGAPSLGLGVSARTESVADANSINGVLTSVTVEQQPILVVNRQTGETSIRNPGSTASVAFDAYVVGSNLGGLNPAGWDSIAPAAGWDQANPTNTAISELNPLSSQSVTGGETIALGTIFDAAELGFGDNAEDVSFRFAAEGQGFTEGVVVYEGIPTDTLTLNVDRTTGAAQIINGFRETVSIDTYLISSASESLAVSPGGWEALGGGWEVGVNETGRVSELNPLTSLDLGSNAAASLGDLYDFDAAGAEEDLVFQFTLPSENFFRTGKVVFADELTVLAPGLAADFNGDGTVDLLDLDILGSNFGSTGATMAQGDANGDGSVDLLDLDILGSTFGQTASAVAIPEPATICVLIGLLPAMAARAARTRS